MEDILKKKYAIVDTHKYDPEKKNIILFLLERNISKNTNMLSYSYILNTVEVMSKDFNVFLIGKSSSAKGIWVDIARQTPVLDKCIYINLDADGSFMRAETGEKKYMELHQDDDMMYFYTHKHLVKRFKKIINTEKWIFDNMVGTISSAFYLVYERNHEIIPTDLSEEAKAKKAKDTAHRRITNQRQFYSFRMISQRNMHPLHFLIELMKKYPEKWHYSFCHDTSAVWYLWSKRVNPYTQNVKNFYFVNDNRGLMRDFTEFPSGPIQDAYKKTQLTKDELNEIINNKYRDFIFGGTFPYDVSYRLSDWDRYFEHLRGDVLIRTQTDGTSTISQSEIKDPLETKKFKGKKIKDERAFEIIRKISKNKNVQPTVSQDKYFEEQKEFMFTIILRCFYGKYDSLNFRIYSSLVNGIIPLIADDYDFENLQIPQKFKKFLVVKNDKDIEEKVKYYKENIEEYRELFWDLYTHFVKDEHFDLDWYDKEFKENYFKELYN